MFKSSVTQKSRITVKCFVALLILRVFCFRFVVRTFFQSLRNFGDVFVSFVFTRMIESSYAFGRFRNALKRIGSRGDVCLPVLLPNP